ncbi:hypothetical protein L227DRAFT_349936 [Lentinus tigrinus ALCF2SS1-6]|uniref:Uncharacterized protein n=1 Tax=Lentinus tigrinus ALCF2SS1-6 TaxID=1328759 RepID=A0A5C2RSW4_9APHY|nr:hypothetical protein L227DRAFT_349936 [Lentinus tigrinus ALCF2SS1-6]
MVARCEGWTRIRSNGDPTTTVALGGHLDLIFYPRICIPGWRHRTDDEDNYSGLQPKAISPLRRYTARADTGPGWSDPAISSTFRVRERVPQVLRESPDPMSSSEPDDPPELDADLGYLGGVAISRSGVKYDARTYPPRVRSPSRIPVPKQGSAMVARTAFEAERPPAGPVAKRSRGTPGSALLPTGQGDKDASAGAVVDGEVSLSAADKSQAERPRGGLGGGSNGASGTAAAALTQDPVPSGSKAPNQSQTPGAIPRFAGDASGDRPGRGATAPEAQGKRGADKRNGVDNDRPAPSGSAHASSLSVASAPQSDPGRALSGMGVASSKPQPATKLVAISPTQLCAATSGAWMIFSVSCYL